MYNWSIQNYFYFLFSETDLKIVLDLLDRIINNGIFPQVVATHTLSYAMLLSTMIQKEFFTRTRHKGISLSLILYLHTEKGRKDKSLTDGDLKTYNSMPPTDKNRVPFFEAKEVAAIACMPIATV